jgi:hypothetical protein
MPRGEASDPRCACWRRIRARPRRDDAPLQRSRHARLFYDLLRPGMCSPRLSLTYYPAAETEGAEQIYRKRSETKAA